MASHVQVGGVGPEYEAEAIAPGQGYAVASVVADLTAAAELIAAPGANKRIAVYAYSLSSVGAQEVVFNSSVGGNVWNPFVFAANGGANLVSQPSAPLFKGGVNGSLRLNRPSGALRVTVAVSYYIEDV